MNKNDRRAEMPESKAQSTRTSSKLLSWRNNGALLSFRVAAQFSFWLILALSGVARADDTVMEVIQINNRPAEELQPLLAPLLEEGDRVISAGSNLVVKTTPERLQGIVVLIKKLDAKPNNLIVSVLQSSTKTAAELNADAALAVSPSVIQLRGGVGDARKRNNQQSTQLVRTLEGQTAYIKTGNIRPVRNFSVYRSGHGYPVASSHTQLFEASTGFAVIPRLVGQQVMIEVEPWSDRFQQGGSIETQGARTSLRANLGEWVEIAGSDTGERSERGGLGVYHRGAAEQHLRIFIKIDKAD